MKIAVTYDNGEIFQHFGHTEQFKLYDIENGKVVASEVVGTNGSGHGALAGFLAEHQVQVLICGGIGGGAQNALAQAGIKLFGGCSGNADQAVEALLEGQLNYDADVKCGSRMVDAKSIVGVLSLAKSKTVELILHTDDCDQLMEEIAPFAA